MRESAVFYRTMYEMAQLHKKDVQADIYNAVMNYAFNGVEPTGEGKSSAIVMSVFMLLKPLIDKNNKRYENGCKGGRPKPNNNQTITKPKPNNNQTETKGKPYDNDNVQCKCTMNNDNEDADVNASSASHSQPAKRRQAFKADLSFIGDSVWEELIKGWLDYKQARGEKYKSDESIKALYLKLQQLSGGDIETARQVVMQSMSNNWAGLFALKQTKEKERQPIDIDRCIEAGMALQRKYGTRPI